MPTMSATYFRPRAAAARGPSTPQSSSRFFQPENNVQDTPDSPLARFGDTSSRSPFDFTFQPKSTAPIPPPQWARSRLSDYISESPATPSRDANDSKFLSPSGMSDVTYVESDDEDDEDGFQVVSNAKSALLDRDANLQAQLYEEKEKAASLRVEVDRLNRQLYRAKKDAADASRECEKMRKELVEERVARVTAEKRASLAEETAHKFFRPIINDMRSKWADLEAEVVKWREKYDAKKMKWNGEKATLQKETLKLKVQLEQAEEKSKDAESRARSAEAQKVSLEARLSDFLAVVPRATPSAPVAISRVSLQPRLTDVVPVSPRAITSRGKLHEHRVSVASNPLPRAPVVTDVPNCTSSYGHMWSLKGTNGDQRRYRCGTCNFFTQEWKSSDGYWYLR
ncbi:hypothetical protein BXZ70DRAFT_1066513 [Cristinia sonorae]|uniref:Uncharacterized protein n=1 Tax=Cristinia sonorae TaxID=1940300 RepID=A0A8K0UJI1_9AGAR|nr:hypothetical protein BXZ70DRAFT_1066513 [Cristinia sonorae]